MATVKHTLYEVFLDSVRRHPAEPAIEVSGRPLSYRDLHRAAELIAETIVRSHGPVKRVGLLATRSVVAYAGYLAILRLGASVVPLNLRYPARRNHDICELGDVDVILADTMGQDWLDRERPGDGPAVLPLTDADVLAGSPDGRLSPYEADTERVAYLLFTSGSTGRPKGVPIRHRNVLPMVAHNIARYRVEPGCRMSHTFDLTFDVSVFDLFVTWGGGACLVVPE
ncbi:MAG: AMP-binding protein, partial [Actinoallomurus sp.]